MKNILVCHDGSSLASATLMDYIREEEAPYAIVIFHALEPFPPNLLEHSGSDNPDEEKRRLTKMEERRGRWLSERMESINKELQPLIRRLQNAHNPPQTLAVKIVPSYVSNDFIPLLEMEVSFADYDEILLAHHPESWLRKLVHLTEQDLVRKALPMMTVRDISTPD